MLRCAAFAVASAILASGVAAASVTAGEPHRFVGQRHGWMTPNANPKHPWLYVAGFNNGVISIYDLTILGTPLIGQITQIPTPNGIALDARGTLYVTTYDNNTVEIYPPGATSPSLTLSQGLSVAVDVAVDVNGDVFVVNRGTTPNVTVFPPGQTVPSATITSNLFQHPMALVFDSKRNLYISDFYTSVSEVAYGSQQPVSLGLLGTLRTLGITTDPVNGNLFACVDLRRKGTQTVDYAPGHVRSRHVLNGGNVAGDFMTTGIVRGTEYLFESIYNTSQVLVYRHDSKNLYATLTTASANAEGVAFKPAGVP